MGAAQSEFVAMSTATTEAGLRTFWQRKHKSRKRFSLLLLAEDEVLLDDVVCDWFPPARSDVDSIKKYVERLLSLP